MGGRMLAQNTKGRRWESVSDGHLCGCIAATQGRCIPFGAAAPSRNNAGNNDSSGIPLNLVPATLRLEKNRQRLFFRGIRP